MTDLRAIIVAALIVAPAACRHDERPAQSPERGTAGAGAAAPAPAPDTTNEPSNIESPKLNETPRQTDPTGTAPISDSRTRTTPFEVAQNTGGYGGMPGGGTGGSIITAR